MRKYKLKWDTFSIQKEGFLFYKEKRFKGGLIIGFYYNEFDNVLSRVHLTLKLILK